VQNSFQRANNLIQYIVEQMTCEIRAPSFIWIAPFPFPLAISSQRTRGLKDVDGNIKKERLDVCTI
jgi:hypothetical protein